MNLLSGLGTVSDTLSGQCLTGRELAAKATTGAAQLQRIGAGRGRVVMLCHGSTPRFFADLLSIWATGAIAAVIDPASSLAEVETIAGFVKPVAIVVGEQGLTTSAAKVMSLDDVSAARMIPIGSSMDDPALILFTSGTTGEPKGVVHTFRSILARTDLLIALTSVTPICRKQCGVLPTHFGHGLIGNCLMLLFAGRDLFLAYGRNVQFFSKISEMIDRHEITFMSSVPGLELGAARFAATPKQVTSSYSHRVGNAVARPLDVGNRMEWNATGRQYVWDD